nr:MAG TPA: hypothetical protein [Caudoviricetes sp.]
MLIEMLKEGFFYTTHNGRQTRSILSFPAARRAAIFVP